MKLKKILSLAVVLATLLSVLTSCGKSFGDRMQMCEKHFRSNQSKVDISLELCCLDEELSGACRELQRNKTTIYFDGTKFKAVNEIGMSVGEDEYYFNTVYTGVNGAFYSHTTYSHADGAQTGDKKSWASVSADELKALASRICLVGGVTADGFGSVSETKLGKKSFSAKYTDPSDSVRSAVEKMMTRLFEGACESVSAKNATLTVNLKDGHYESAVVECEVDVVINEKTYTVGAVVRLSFSFDDTVTVTSPSDFSDYQKQTIENILSIQ